MKRHIVEVQKFDRATADPTVLKMLAEWNEVARLNRERRAEAANREQKNARRSDRSR